MPTGTVKSGKMSTSHTFGGGAYFSKVPRVLGWLNFSVDSVCSRYLSFHSCLGGNNHTAHQTLITKSISPFWKGVTLLL